MNGEFVLTYGIFIAGIFASGQSQTIALHTQVLFYSRRNIAMNCWNPHSLVWVWGTGILWQCYSEKPLASSSCSVQRVCKIVDPLMARYVCSAGSNTDTSRLWSACVRVAIACLCVLAAAPHPAGAQKLMSVFIREEEYARLTGEPGPTMFPLASSLFITV